MSNYSHSGFSVGLISICPLGYFYSAITHCSIIGSPTAYDRIGVLVVSLTNVIIWLVDISLDSVVYRVVLGVYIVQMCELRARSILCG